jgi:hypothetical protein
VGTDDDVVDLPDALALLEHCHLVFSALTDRIVSQVDGEQLGTAAEELLDYLDVFHFVPLDIEHE